MTIYGAVMGGMAFVNCAAVKEPRFMFCGALIVHCFRTVIFTVKVAVFVPAITGVEERAARQQMAVKRLRMDHPTGVGSRPKTTYVN